MQRKHSYDAQTYLPKGHFSFKGLQIDNIRINKVDGISKYQHEISGTLKNETLRQTRLQSIVIERVIYQRNVHSVKKQ